MIFDRYQDGFEALKGVSLQIAQAVEDVNAAQKKVIVEKILQDFGSDLSGIHFAIWGLAFKPNTDDIREAPALETIDALLKAGAKVQVYDPEAMENVKGIYGDSITFTTSKYACIIGANALAIMTEWNEFRTPDFNEIRSNLTDNIVFDGRNLFDINNLKDAGLDYISIGRPALVYTK